MGFVLMIQDCFMVAAASTYPTANRTVESPPQISKCRGTEAYELVHVFYHGITVQYNFPLMLRYSAIFLPALPIYKFIRNVT